METEFLRRALLTLLREIYFSPSDPKVTWVVSNQPDAGLLGTLRHLTPAQAHAKPPNVAHSIAEHAAHLKFTLEVALRYAKGATPGPEAWDTSWNPGRPTDADWSALQGEIKRSADALIAFAEKEETFAQFETVCGFIGQVAHGAYHLGAIRQLVPQAKA